SYLKEWRQIATSGPSEPWKNADELAESIGASKWADLDKIKQYRCKEEFADGRQLQRVMMESQGEAVGRECSWNDVVDSVGCKVSDGDAYDYSDGFSRPGRCGDRH
ncbi:unnamed protein product, partial [Ascophyllum nodosum]